MCLTPVATYHYLIISLIRMENKQICKEIIKDLHGKKIEGKKGPQKVPLV